MNFRSDRSATGNVLLINFIPELTKQHTYSLAAIYPYATQANGEMGAEGIISYKIKKNSILGGKYGTIVTLDVSQMNSLDMKVPDDTAAVGEAGTMGYKSDFFKLGKDVYFKDLTLEVHHKFSKKFKAIFSYVNLIYDIAVIQGHVGNPNVYANIGIVDLTYKFTTVKSIRMELQHLSTKQDEGDWAMVLIEYTIAPKWFFSLMDQYNYGNPESVKQVHYYTAGFGFNKNANSILISYGRQREGILCVGGVCRVVPASYGLSLTVTSSF